MLRYKNQNHLLLKAGLFWLQQTTSKYKYKSMFSNLPKKGTQGGLIDLSFTRYFLK